MEGPNAEMVGKEYKAMADDIRQLRFIMRFPFYKFSNSWKRKAPNQTIIECRQIFALPMNRRCS